MSRLSWPTVASLVTEVIPDSKRQVIDHGHQSLPSRGPEVQGGPSSIPVVRTPQDLTPRLQANPTYKSLVTPQIQEGAQSDTAAVSEGKVLR